MVIPKLIYIDKESIRGINFDEDLETDLNIEELKNLPLTQKKIG